MDGEPLNLPERSLPEAVVPPDADLPTGVTQYPSVDEDAIRKAFETGEYPYHRPMGRRAYEEEKARLQAELLRSRSGRRRRGRNSSFCSKGAMRRARAARSSGSWNI